ncbi:MAG: PaaI family thioesterase [Halieaceae bacterium]|jgi:uncharacterized protein (TIGR00369 family)|nr:PaaI family thioesterase [Halieaceae bacterium]
MAAAKMTIEKIQDFMAADFPQARTRVLEVTGDSARVRCAIGHSDLRPGGTVSGPSIMAVADFALYVAIFAALGPVPLAVTTNLNINFLNKPSAGADLVGECRLIKVGKRLVVGEVNVYSDGREGLVAHVTGTYSVPPEYLET